MRRKAKYPAIVLMILVAVAVLGLAVMVLWNRVVTGLFAGIHPLDYPHALGLLVLCRILFGGFRGHRGGGCHHGWKRWRTLTPEERGSLLNQCSPRP